MVLAILFWNEMEYYNLNNAMLVAKVLIFAFFFCEAW